MPDLQLVPTTQHQAILLSRVAPVFPVRAAAPRIMITLPAGVSVRSTSRRIPAGTVLDARSICGPAFITRAAHVIVRMAVSLAVSLAVPVAVCVRVCMAVLDGRLQPSCNRPRVSSPHCSSHGVIGMFIGIHDGCAPTADAHPRRMRICTHVIAGKDKPGRVEGTARVE